MPTPLINTGSPSLVPVTGRPWPVSMYDIIAWVETKNIPHAMRFEPAVYDKVCKYPMIGGANLTLDKIRLANACSWGTAHMIYSTSFGAVQIMGFNVYDLDYSGDIVRFCEDTVAQAALFDRFCQVKGLSHSVSDIASLPILRHDFARIYNGDADAYAPLMVQALKHFGIEVTA